MKNIFLIILATLIVLSASTFAHIIEGTPVLKGSIRTKIIVNGLQTTCRVKVEKIKNLMLEDSFGNPAYNVRISVNLSGHNQQRTVSVKFDRDYWLNNLYAVGNKTQVRDLEYTSSEGSKMMIDRNGRIRSVNFSFEGRLITCSF